MKVLDLSVSMAIITQRSYYSPPHSSFVVSSSDALAAGSYTSSGCGERAGRHRNRARLFVHYITPRGGQPYPICQPIGPNPVGGLYPPAIGVFQLQSVSLIVVGPSHAPSRTPARSPAPFCLRPVVAQVSILSIYMFRFCFPKKNWRDWGSVGHTTESFPAEVF